MQLTKEQQALLRAVRQQHVAQLRDMLHNKHVSPNFPSYSYITTPLHEAVKKGNLAIIKILVEAGADVSATTRDGATPQGLAEDIQANKSIIRYLKSEGVKLPGGATPAPGRKKTLPEKKPFTPQAAPPAIKQVFNAKTLPEIFKAGKWVGNVEKMQQLWETVPKKLKGKFDFAAQLTEARLKTLKNNAPKKNVLKKSALKKPNPPPAG